MKVKLVGKSRQTADLSIARLLKENTFPSSGSARRNWLDPIARGNTDRERSSDRRSARHTHA
jgi:hypothetical protein